MTHGDVERRVEELKAALRRAGIKQTNQRLAIYREVLARHDHPDAESVHAAVRRRLPAVSLDTVYRTLWTLTDLGLLSTLGPRQARARFDANVAPHHHFVCVDCGLVRDFESPTLDALRLPDEVAAFGEALATHVEVRGRCRACAARER